MGQINILVDCSNIRTELKIPISMYIYTGRLLNGLNNSNDIHPIALVCNGMEHYVDSIAGYAVDKIIFNGNEHRSPSIKLDRFLGLIPRSIEDQMEQRNIRLVLVPELTPYTFTFPKKWHPTIIVHDLFRIHHPRERGYKRIYLAALTKLKAIGATQLISISESTRQAVKKWCGRDTLVIHNSINFDFTCKEEPIDELTGKQYILDVNRFAIYKNVDALIKAFYLIRDKIPHLLYLKGVSQNNDILISKKLVYDLKIEDRVVFDISSRSEGEMRWLYSHADLFVTPSKEEGFGSTPLEAAMLKVPTIISNIDTLMEVAQGKLPSFDPSSPDELATLMINMLTNPPTEEERETISRYYRQTYSLEHNIEQFNEVIKQQLR